MHTAWLGLIVVVGFLGSDGSEDAMKREKEKLKGTWVATEMMAGGRKQEIETRFEFDGDKITMRVKGKPAETSTFTIDPGKSPATLDIVLEREGKKVTMPAVYELKGDQLTICHPFVESGDRPKALEATAKTVLVTFKRQKS